MHDRHEFGSPLTAIGVCLRIWRKSTQIKSDLPVVGGGAITSIKRSWRRLPPQIITKIQVMEARNGPNAADLRKVLTKLTCTPWLVNLGLKKVLRSACSLHQYLMLMLLLHKEGCCSLQEKKNMKKANLARVSCCATYGGYARFSITSVVVVHMEPSTLGERSVRRVVAVTYHRRLAILFGAMWRGMPSVTERTQSS